MGGHGEPVQLQLSHAGNVADTVQEIAQLLLVQRVIEAEHLGGVGYLDESLTWLAANALRRGIRREQLRVRLFKIRKLAHQGVVFGVGDLRIVEDVVEPLVMAQSLPELFGLCDRLAVMSRGRLSAARPIAEWTPETVLATAIGGASEEL